MRLIRHFARLQPGLLIVWLFLIWYVTMVGLHFEAAPRLWLNALAMATLVGTALLLSVQHGAAASLGFWRTFRLYAIPFCVSSFSALVRDDGFYAIFAPSVSENLLAAGCCGLFLCWVGWARWLDRSTEQRS